MLNSFWGKFGQREDLVKTEIVDEPGRLYDLMKSHDETEVKDVRFINEDILEVHKEKENFTYTNSRVNVVIAAFTTCHARLRLYDVIDRLSETVLYLDTDSVVYISSPGEWDPPTGDYLGNLTNEISPKDGNFIRSFVTGGPQNYAYTLDTGKTVCKVRGITLNYKNAQIVNYDTLYQMVQNIHSPQPHVVSVHNPRKITRDAISKQIVNKPMTKDYRVVYDKRVILNDFRTVPYGYNVANNLMNDKMTKVILSVQWSKDSRSC